VTLLTEPPSYCVTLLSEPQSYCVTLLTEPQSYCVTLLTEPPSYCVTLLTEPPSYCVTLLIMITNKVNTLHVAAAMFERICSFFSKVGNNGHGNSILSVFMHG
jgi:hypothetical protein